MHLAEATCHASSQLRCFHFQRDIQYVVGANSSLASCIMSGSINSSDHEAHESSDEDYPSGDNPECFRLSLNARLEQVKTSGSFATAGKFLRLD